MKKITLSNKSAKAGAGNASPDDDGAEEKEVLFWINKSGFPISDNVWDRMFDHACQLHPAGKSAIMAIKGTFNPSSVALPKPPINVSPSLSAEKRVEMVQNYMRELQYNHTGTQFFDIKKYKSMSSHTEVAKEMIKESLPIKCLEAVVLGIYLTNGISGLERYPLSFRSVFGNNIHRHVVLIVSCNGLFGTLGMSRREDLMYKPLKYTCLSDLVIDFIESYHQFWHKVDKCKIGFPVSHDPYSHEPIHWKGLVVNPSKMTRAELKQAVDKHSKDVRMWVRQAPVGVTYAPRTQATSTYPTPTTSNGLPLKSRMDTSNESSVRIAKDSDNEWSATAEKSLSHSAQKPTKSFEMRI